MPASILTPLFVMMVALASLSTSTVLWTFGSFAVAHAVFVVRVLGARRFAATQRPRDTELFQEAARPRH
jgi:hypothetical protein